MAREAGVSTATVSRVVHGQDKVRPVTRRRVLAVIEALGYVPDSAAQSMARKRKEMIGFAVIHDHGPGTAGPEGMPFIDEVLGGAEETLRRSGWPVLVSVRGDTDPAAAYRWLRKIAARVDGLLLAEGLEPAERLASLASRIPLVVVSGSLDEVSADVVGVDNEAGTRALVSHLVEQHGRTKLFYVAGPRDAPDARERRRAFEGALARYPGVRLAGCWEGRFSAVTGQLAAREILAAPRDQLPDAVICASDQIAIGAIRELRAAGIQIPADVAIAGFDGIHLGALTVPALTTVHHPMRLLGERACTLLLERIADPDLPRRAERLPATLIVRESCGCPATPLTS